MFSDSDRLIEGVLIRAIQPFAAPHRERAADSGNTVAPMPLAMAAVRVVMDSMSKKEKVLMRREMGEAAHQR